MSEDGLHREGILHSGDDAQAAATAGTGEDIESEHRRIKAAQVHGSGVPAARGLASRSRTLTAGAGRP